MSETVSVERPSDGVVVLTVSNPDIDNQASFETVEALAIKLKEAREGGDRIAVIASGLKSHWVGHAYLKDLVGMFQGKPTSGNPMAFFLLMTEVLHADLTVVAAVGGAAIGGGAELAWACDLRVASTRATFCQPELEMGIAPGLGGAGRLAQLGGRAIAAEMNLDGQPVGAERLHALGVINRLVPDGEATAAAVAWATQLARHDRSVLSTLKKQLDNAFALPLPEAMKKEQQLFGVLATQPGAVDKLAEIQARYDAGEPASKVLGWD